MFIWSATVCSMTSKIWLFIIVFICITHDKVIECFHMTSRGPYGWPKPIKRRCWCPKSILWELNSFLLQTLSFVPINLHRCWPSEWKHSIHSPSQGISSSISSPIVSVSSPSNETVEEATSCFLQTRDFKTRKMNKFSHNTFPLFKRKPRKTCLSNALKQSMKGIQSFCSRSCLKGEETAKISKSAIRRDFYWHVILGGKNRWLVKEDEEKYTCTVSDLTWVLLIRVWLFVINISRVLAPLVGSVISWVRLLSRGLYGSPPLPASATKTNYYRDI